MWSPFNGLKELLRSLEQPEKNLSEIEELLDDIMKELEELETEDELAGTEQLDDEYSSN